ncbi:MAG: hypothetical protein AAB383_00655 [Patescibacteria group bacterium]
MGALGLKKYGEELDDDESPNLKKPQLREMESNGESGWGGIRDLRDEDKEKQKDLIKALREFQSQSGINEENHINKLQKCTKKSELMEMERKFKKAGTEWYKLQMKKSGAFEPLDVREEALINQELDGLTSWFSSLELHGETSMISTLNDLDENMALKIAFRKKLKKQSKFIQSEYFRRLGSLPLIGSKEKLLENILKGLEEVEEAPSAVQYEYKKIQKSAQAGKSTAEIKKEVMTGYKVRADAYQKMLADNKQYFGADTDQEFMEWFDERENFAEMDAAAKKLPSLIKERKKLFTKRDGILKNCSPEQKKKLLEKTNDMRRHELEKFLPEMEQLVRNNNVHTAEYMATLYTARVSNIDLYQPFETTRNIQKFKLNDLETQKAKLVVLKEEIEERAAVVRNYLALPSYLRKDEVFLRAHALDREAFVADAWEQQHREQTHPFDTSNVDHLDSEGIQDTSEQIESEEGEDMMEDVLEELGQEGQLIAVDFQRKTHDKIFGAAEKAKTYGESQEQHYLRDLKFWTRVDENVKHESDVSTERERSKFRFIQAANEAYDEDYVFTSGGTVRRAETVSAQDLKNGGTMNTEKLKRARYGEHVKVKDGEGKMAQDPLEMIEKLSGQELMRLVLLAINKMGKKHMKLGDGNLQLLRNSTNIKKAIGTRIIDMEMTHMEDSEQQPV